MKKIVLTGAAFVAFGVAPAIAADLAAVPYYTKAPVVPALYNWAGFYAGLNAGGASSHNCWNINNAVGVAVPSTAEGCHNATGALAGGQIYVRTNDALFCFGSGNR